MVTKRSVGNTSIGVGSLILALGAIFLVLAYFNNTMNKAWFVQLPWLTEFFASSVGIVIGVILIGFGVYMRRTLGGYVHRISKREEELEKAKAVAERRSRAVYRVSGKLGDRTKRLKQIEKLVKVPKKRKSK
ncbi:MAG: hypothetical protein AB1476_05815 [Candidatus Hadarchaeota archaeon]